MTNTQRTTARWLLVSTLALASGCGGGTTPDAGSGDVVADQPATADARAEAATNDVADAAPIDVVNDVAAVDVPRDSSSADGLSLDTGADVVSVDVRAADALTDAVSRDTTVTDSGGASMVGDFCGGIAAIACGSGLRCVDDMPGVPDGGGHCHALSGIGGPCGGSIRFPPVCDTGLRCTFPDVIMPGGHGTCSSG